MMTSEKDVDADLKCPLSNEIMCDPILCTDGLTYDRFAVVDAITNGSRSHITDQEIIMVGQVVALRNIIYKMHPEKESEAKEKLIKVRQEIEEHYLKA